MAASYSKTSPWANTKVSNFYLDRLSIRPVNAEKDDYLYTIQSQYKWRPDLLAYDLYGDDNLWWVFVQRNLEVLRDPIFDFVPGTKIYIPKPLELKQLLGI